MADLRSPSRAETPTPTAALGARYEAGALAVTVLLEQLESQRSIEKRLYQVSEREVHGTHLRPEAIG